MQLVTCGMVVNEWLSPLLMTYYILCVFLVCDFGFLHIALHEYISHNILFVNLFFLTLTLSQLAWRSVGQRVDALINHPFCPSIIRFVVQKIKGYLTWMPQPRQQQQQQ